MKKLLLFVSAFLTCVGANAQINATQNCILNSLSGPNMSYGKNPASSTNSYLKAGGDIIWENDFSVAQDWTIGTNGQGTFIIGTNTHPEIASTSGLSGYMGTMATSGTTAGNGFAFFNGVQHLINGSVDPQESWVTSDTIDLSSYTQGSIVLSFNQRYRHLNYDSTLVDVSIDGGQSWVTYTVNEGFITNDPAVQNTVLKLIPISPSALTMLRFRWKSDSDNDQFGSGYGWMIDDVKLVEPFLDEVAVTKVFTNDVVNSYDYYSTPLTQVAPMTYGAIVQNLGSQSVTKYIKFNVVQTSSVFQDSALVTLLPGSEDTVWLNNSYSPDQLGTYTLEVTVQDQGVISNNLLSDEFVVTNYIYGHNYPISGNLTFGFNTLDAELGMGNIYACNAAQQLNGIQVLFGTGTTANTEVRIEVYEVLTSIQDINNIYITEAYYTTPSPVNTSTPVDIVFDSPIFLEAGKMYMIIAKYFQTSATKIRFKGTSKGNDDLSTIGFGPFGSGNAVNYYVGWSVAPYISLNFDPILNVAEQTEISQAVVLPNPTTANASLRFDLQNTADVTVVVTDVAGKIMQSNAMNQLSAGAQEITLSAEQWAAGIYTVRITSNGNALTKKFVKR
jgi:hypothetical protein